VKDGYWSLHTHSRYSIDDALSDVTELVERAVELGYPALGLTDHGGMPGVVQLYKAGKKHGLPVAPGVEMYLTPAHEARDRKAMHLTMAAYTGEGYRNLVALNNQAQSQRFNKRGRLDMADFAAAAEAGKTAGIAVATGCRSGPVVRALTERDEIAAAQVVKALAAWFPKVYVELMDHGFTADGMWDWEICNTLIDIAGQLGLPTILTGDAHYTYEADRESHNALKQLTTWSDDPEDGEFSGTGYWLRAHTDLDPLQHGFEGLSDLAAALKVKIPELDVFTAKVPDVTFRGAQEEVLREKVAAAWEAQKDRWSAKEQKIRKQRIDDELPVIHASDMDGYVLLCEWLATFMEDRGIWFHVRGSAAGSFVLYLLGVTQYDPLPDEWDIRMERFLSGDRSSMPDVDFDIEHERRGEVVAALEAKGYELRQVGTQPVYGLDFKDFDESGEEKGSLRQKYFSVLRKKGIKVESWAEVPDEDKRRLQDLAKRKLISGVGAHPGGYIIAQDAPTVACIPMTTIHSSGTVVTALTKGEVEEMGFPKVDLLGSRVLTGLRICCTLLTGGNVDDVPHTRQEASPAKEYYRAIPMDDRQALKRTGAGHTAGLFQLGGGTNRRGLMQLQPKKTIDIVAAQALMRPAPLNSGFTEEYLNRRSKLKPIPKMHADIDEETHDTYGLAIYQEQVVGILRRIGLPPDQLTKLLKAVKASGKAHIEEAKKIVAGEMASITGMAKARGWDDADIAYLEGCLLDYGAGYSFGKGHSVTYGVVGYLTAFLATHTPLEYWTGQLNAYMGVTNTRGDKIEPILTRAARADDVRVIDAHVNFSGLGYTPDKAKKAIRKGLLSVPQVGVSCALELVSKRPFVSLVDLSQRVSGKVSGAKDLCYGQDPEEAGGAIASLYSHKALSGVPQGTPMRRAKGRIRRCQLCKHTYPTPLEYEDHVEEEHGPDVEAEPAAAATAD
jgi:DNA polymerase-3 subunit alpha